MFDIMYRCWVLIYLTIAPYSDDEALLMKKKNQSLPDVTRKRRELKMLSKYNTRYKEINDFEECPRYIKVENLEEISREEEVRALIKLKCGNLENANKYWLNEEHWRCVFCEKGKDSIEHYVRKCNKVKV